MRRLFLFAFVLSGCIDFDTDFVTYCSVSGRCGDAGTGGGTSSGGGSGGGGGGGSSSLGGGFGGGGMSGPDAGFIIRADGGTVGPLNLIFATTIKNMNHAHLWSPSKTASSAGVWVCGDTYPVDLGRVVHFDGHGWSDIAVPTSKRLNDIDGTADNDLYTVGNSGDVTHFDGNTWSNVGHATSTLTPNLTSIVVSPQRWAVADFEGVIMSGTPVWTTAMQLDSAQDLYGVAATQNLAIAVGEDAFANHTSLVFENSGSGWNNIDVGTSEQLSAVFMLSDTEAFAVGDMSTILHRTSSGWAPETLSDSTEVLTALWGTAADSMWMGGWGGLWRRNAANTWDKYDLNDIDLSFSVTDILGFGTTELWVAGDDGDNTIVAVFRVQ